MKIIRHGMKNTKFYKFYMNAKARCENKKSTSYYLYGKRGIRVYWKRFIEFKDDMYESYLEHCKKYGEKNTSIDRIDNNKGYCKENCRWVTTIEQGNNRRNNRIISIEDKKNTLMNWARKSEINWSTIRSRLENTNMDVKECVYKKPRKAIYKGVYYNKIIKKWYIQFCKDGFRYTRGMFISPLIAKNEYNNLINNI